MSEQDAYWQSAPNGLAVTYPQEGQEAFLFSLRRDMLTRLSYCHDNVGKNHLGNVRDLYHVRCVLGKGLRAGINVGAAFYYPAAPRKFTEGVCR